MFYNLSACEPLFILPVPWLKCYLLCHSKWMLPSTVLPLACMQVFGESIKLLLASPSCLACSGSSPYFHPTHSTPFLSCCLAHLFSAEISDVSCHAACHTTGTYPLRAHRTHLHKLLQPVLSSECNTLHWLCPLIFPHCPDLGAGIYQPLPMSLLHKRKKILIAFKKHYSV